MSVPYRQREHRPGHPWLQRAVADAQQQRRGVVEAPFVRAAQVAVLHLVGEEVEGIQSLEQRRRIGRCRIGGTHAAEAARHLNVMAADERLLLRGPVIGCVACGGALQCVSRARVFAGPWSFGLAMDGTRPWRRVFAQSCPPGGLAALARRAVLIIETSLLGRPTRDARDRIAHRGIFATLDWGFVAGRTSAICFIVPASLNRR